MWRLLQLRVCSSLSPVSCLQVAMESPQAEELVSNSSEVVDEGNWQSSRGEKDSELPAGVQEGEPRPLKRSRRCAVPLMTHFPLSSCH